MIIFVNTCNAYYRQMPANLNALIRYRTINDCLSTGRRYTIDELVEACSEAIRESTPGEGGVSERTVRNDIRVMRSDILGVNAPIAQKDGYYYYSDGSFSLINVLMSGSDLVDKIIVMLNEIRGQISHPELDNVLKGLKKVKSKTIISHSIEKSIILEESQNQVFFEPMAFKTFSESKKPVLKPTWGDLFEILSSLKKGE